MAELVCVDPGQVHLVWPHVAPLLRRAIARTGISLFSDLERDVLRGDALLWLAISGGGSAATIDAAASTSLHQTEAGKVCVITACAGSNMSRWLPLIAGIEAFARNEGCKCVRIFGRKGWLRALEGYEEKHVIVDKELN